MHDLDFFRVLLRIRNRMDITNLVLTTNLVKSLAPFHMVNVSVSDHFHWSGGLLIGGWMLLLVVLEMVSFLPVLFTVLMEEELRGLLLRTLLARTLQVFLYW